MAPSPAPSPSFPSPLPLWSDADAWLRWADRLGPLSQAWRAAHPDRPPLIHAVVEAAIKGPTVSSRPQAWPRLVQALVESGVDVNEPDPKRGGLSALHLAIQYKELSATEALLKLGGANPNAEAQVGRPLDVLDGHPQDDVTFAFQVLLLDAGASTTQPSPNAGPCLLIQWIDELDAETAPGRILRHRFALVTRAMNDPAANDWMSQDPAVGQTPIGRLRASAQYLPMVRWAGQSSRRWKRRATRRR